MKAQLHVIQMRAIGNRNHLATLKGLGLRGPHSEVWVKNTPSFRGAIKKVLHLVTVEEVDSAPAKSPAKKKS
jgi:large subunit ribosomal protein L30